MKNKYVLAGIRKNGEKLYYVKTNWNGFYGYDVRIYTLDISTAATFNSLNKAKNLLRELHDPFLKIYPICPICGKDYDGHPAISRKDNKTKICPECGVGEAFMDFIEHKEYNNSQDIMDFIEKQKRATFS